MGKFLYQLLNIFETFTGPLDWRCKRINGHITYLGRFLIHNRWGLIRSGVLGMIVERDANLAEVYLYDPPRFVLKHKHGRCMQLLTPNAKWFKLHFDKPASNFPEAYTYVEHMLAEAYNLSP